MHRGYFDFMVSNETYAKASKNWYASPLQCDCFWFDLVVNPPFSATDPEPIKIHLQSLKKVVEDSIEKRFIYFYGSRKKIRLDPRKPLNKHFFSRGVSVNILVGAQSKRQRVRCDLAPCGITDPRTCQVHATEKLISLSQDGKNWITLSIHDLLQKCAIDDIKDSTNIHYVGLTKNPHTRPLGREHRGYGDMVYGVGSDDHDFFLYVTIFRTMTSALNSRHGMHFFVANSMTDEIAVQPEGQLIEGALIAYFNSEFQDEQGAGERAKLEAHLRRIKNEQSIESLIVDFEIEGLSPYYRLGSSTQTASHRHVFRCMLVDDKLTVESLPNNFDATSLFA